jgi:hypothetical protein
MWKPAYAARYAGREVSIRQRAERQVHHRTHGEVVRLDREAVAEREPEQKKTLLAVAW